MTDDEQARGGGLRGRFRVHIRDEIKTVALRQLADGGPQALSINAIAKELGVTGPALYRYFVNRDDLLTELVADAYHDLAVALAEAVVTETKRHRRPPDQRLRALARAYRDWAKAEPHRYRLLFRAPLPGYDAQSERLVAASGEAMEVLLDVFADFTPKHPPAVPAALERQLTDWAHRRQLAGVASVRIAPAHLLGAVVAWTRLHGLVALEIEGNYASMGIGAELLFDLEVSATIANWVMPA